MGLSPNGSTHVRRTASAAPPIERPLLVVALGLTLVAHVHFVVSQNVNWDEFWFLSFIHDHSRGTLATPLQTFHVHLFGWLTKIDGQEVDQIIVARATFLLLLLGTCACVYRLARRVASVNGSLFAVLCCAAYSNILYHGASFRTDGLSVFLLMAALVLVQSTSRRFLALSGGAVLVALALLITVKSVFFLPTVALLLVTSRPRGSARTRGEVLLFLSVLVGTTLALYFWHSGAIVASTGRDPVAYLQSSATRVIRRDVLFPGLPYFVGSVLGNLVQWALLVYAVAALGRRLLLRQQVLEACSLLALALPLLSLLFYRNAFPYFYVFLMPPALVLCGLAFDELTPASRPGSRRTIPLTAFATLAIAGAVIGYVTTRLSDRTVAQREVIRAVHDVFPQPVPYIDRNGMISSFPKVGFFMSTWGLENYRSDGRPVFADVLRTHRPKFLIVNSPALSSVFANDRSREEEEHLLLEEDAAVLLDNFVPYWGPVYVAGKQIRLERGGQASWEVLSGGSYQLLSKAPVTINHSLYAPGSTVVLEMGTVSLRSHVTQDVVLRAGDVRGVPSYPPPDGPLYTGF